MVSNAKRKRLRVCSWCDRSFLKDEHLARHIRSHTHEKPFKCAECGKRFSRNDSLLRHARSHRPQSNCSASGSQDPISTPECLGQNGALPCFSELNSVLEFDLHNQSTEKQTWAEPEPSYTSRPVNQLSNDFNRTGEKMASEINQSINSPDTNNSWALDVPNLLSTQPDCTQLGSRHGNTTYLSPNITDLSDPQNVFDLSCQTPTWLAGEELDIDALNSSILSSIGYADPSGLGHYGAVAPETHSDHPLCSSDDQKLSVEDLVRENWFTYIKNHDSGITTPDYAPKHIHIDDAYRDRLASKLERSLPVCPLPSTDFLNLCIEMYFTRFHPVFPILHAPTFRPSAKRALLLISVCSIGSLFLSSQAAINHGTRIFETLNKAILASWEKCILTGGTEAIAMAQAAILGQTFALLSSRKKDLLTAQTFHGTVIAWARRLDVFRVNRSPEKIDTHATTNGLGQAWKKWIQREERNRVAAALFIHDVELAELSMSDRFLRHKASDLPPVCDEILWSAPVAEVWADRLNGSTRPSTTDHGCPMQPVPATIRTSFQPQYIITGKDSFRSYIELSGLASSFKETNCYEDVYRDRQSEQQTQLLINIYTSQIGPAKEGAHDAYLRRALWHSTFISTLVSVDRLERAIGREGLDESRQHIKDVREWACSLDGQRCALHAIMILRELERMVLGTEPPIHFPRTVFRAAITWFCYVKFGKDGPDLSQQNLEFPEFKIMEVNCDQILFEANGYRSNRLKSTESSVFRGFIDLLHRVGHWGISSSLASILRLLLPEGTDDEK